MLFTVVLILVEHSLCRDSGQSLAPIPLPSLGKFSYANYAIRRPSAFMFFTLLFQEKNVVSESIRFSDLGARNLCLF